MATVALLLVTSGLLYFMVNTGQAVTEKMRVSNAADAAAYSIGVVEARALNHDAYLNRAMVANQIAIAQTVSLGSWVRYFANAVDEVPASLLETLFMMTPSLDGIKIPAIFAATKLGLTLFTGKDANDYADEVLRTSSGIGPIITLHDTTVKAMEAAQEAVHAETLGGTRRQRIADDVAQAMDPDLKTQVIPTLAGSDDFTKRHDADERRRFADVTTRSLDDFSRERNWTITSPDIPLLKTNGTMKKRAGTELIGYDEWRGMDTLELHGQRLGCGFLGFFFCDDIRRPLGWAAVRIQAPGAAGGRGRHGNAYGDNDRTAYRSEARMEEPSGYTFSGLPAVRELRDLSVNGDPALAFSVFVTKDHAALNTSGGVARVKPSGQLALFDDKPAGAKLGALARASVFFDRISPRADGRLEIGSLYNPYWRVRLVAPTAADRAWASVQQGSLSLP